jgi:teichuronic acid exporter
MLRAGLWSSAESLFRFGLQFAVSVILARILSPKDFGIYALTFIFLSLSSILVDGGFSRALIQRQDTDQPTETAVFLYNILVGGALSLGIAALAPFLAVEYGFPVLRDLLFASAALVFIGSLGAVPSALMNRRLEFAKISRITIFSSLLGSVVGVSAALMGAGIWTFIIQSAVSTIYASVATWMSSDWRPRGPWRLQPARSLTGFSTSLLLSSLLDAGYSNGYPIILAKAYGVLDVAYFNRGQNLQANPSSIVSMTIQRFLFPSLASCTSDAAKMKSMTRNAVSVSAAINTPIMIFLAFFAQLVIGTIYGHKWLPASPVLFVLSISGIVFPLQVINLQVLLAHGDTKRFLKLEIVKKIVGIAFVIVGCFGGAIGIALAQAAFLFIALVLNARPTASLIDYTLAEQIRDCVPSLSISVLVIGALWFVAPLIEMADAFKLLLLLAITGCSYLLLALKLRIGPFRDVLAMLMTRKVQVG